MEIKDMQAFHAVVEEGNISHAAQRLGIAQPALSRQMKRLESELGVRLFERGSRRIRLSDAGEALFSRVERILGMVDGAVREITEIGEGGRGCIRLGAITTSGAMILPRLIAEFHRAFPLVTFQLWEAEGARILELLDNRVIEIAITRTQVDESLYDSIVLQGEPLVIVMPPGGILGERDSEVALEELKGKPLIVPLRWQQAFIDSCHKRGFEPDIIAVSDGIVQDLLLTKMNVGLSLVPLSAVSLLPEGGLTQKKLIEPEISTHTVVAWLKNRPLSSPGRHLIEMFREMFFDKTGENVIWGD